MPYVERSTPTVTREMLQEKSLNDLREIAKLQGVKSLTKYRKNELVDIIMNGGAIPSAVQQPAEPLPSSKPSLIHSPPSLHPDSQYRPQNS